MPQGFPRCRSSSERWRVEASLAQLAHKRHTEFSSGYHLTAKMHEMPIGNQLESIPIAEDVGGVIRVGGTRVTLETIIGAFKDGASAEEIACQYPSNSLISTQRSPTTCATGAVREFASAQAAVDSLRTSRRRASSRRAR